MAQYFISAEDYALGDSFNETPFEATSASISLSVVEDSGRKAFRIQTLGGLWDRNTLNLNHGLVLTGFCEVFAFQRSNADSDHHCMLFTEGVGGSSETGISMNTFGRSDSYRLARFMPAFESLGSASYTVTTPNNSLLRSNGSDDHKIFLWDEGGERPSTPSIDINDTVSYSGDNVTFLTGYPNGIAYVYAIGVGTDGDLAPTAPISVGPTTPTGLITTDITANSFRAGWTP